MNTSVGVLQLSLCPADSIGAPNFLRRVRERCNFHSCTRPKQKRKLCKRYQTRQGVWTCKAKLKEKDRAADILRQRDQL